jgi:TPR repeat protein
MIVPTMQEKIVKTQKSPSIFNKMTIQLETAINEEKKVKVYTKPCLFRFPVVFKNIDLKYKNLGDFYYLGLNGYIQSLQEAVKIYTNQSKDGNAYAQFRLGYCYNYGEGVSKNIPTAMKYYFMSAENGFNLAQAHLGCLYYNGIDIPRDLRKAIIYLNMSNCPYSQYILGCCYYHGHGVLLYKPRAIELWYESANAGLAESQYYMGLMCESGISVKQNYRKAVYWYKRSASQGYVPSIERLANCYRYGYGVIMNKKKALELYKLPNVNVKEEISKIIYNITFSIDDRNEDK